MGAPSLPGFELTQTFFGFNSADQVMLHDRLFDLMWHGAGRWTWDDIYYLPIRIRKLWIARINKMQLQKQEDAETSKNSSTLAKHKQPDRPPVYKNL
jgi:hypothetical protein